MQMKDIPWRYLNERLIAVKDEVLSEVLFSDREGWLLLYGFIDRKYGLQFRVIGNGSKEERRMYDYMDYALCVRYERLERDEVCFCFAQRLCKEDRSKIDGMLEERKRDVPLILERMRRYTCFDAYRINGHPDVLQIPAGTKDGSLVKIRMIGMDGSIFLGRVEEKKTGLYSCGEEVVIHVLRNGDGSMCVYADKKKGSLSRS